jgi:hypothetical protein
MTTDVINLINNWGNTQGYNGLVKSFRKMMTTSSGDFISEFCKVYGISDKKQFKRLLKELNWITPSKKEVKKSISLPKDIFPPKEELSYDNSTLISQLDELETIIKAHKKDDKVYTLSWRGDGKYKINSIKKYVSSVKSKLNAVRILFEGNNLYAILNIIYKEIAANNKLQINPAAIDKALLHYSNKDSERDKAQDVMNIIQVLKELELIKVEVKEGSEDDKGNTTILPVETTFKWLKEAHFIYKMGSGNPVSPVKLETVAGAKIGTTNNRYFKPIESDTIAAKGIDHINSSKIKFNMDDDRFDTFSKIKCVTDTFEGLSERGSWKLDYRNRLDRVYSVLANSRGNVSYHAAVALDGACRMYDSNNFVGVQDSKEIRKWLRASRSYKLTMSKEVKQLIACYIAEEFHTCKIKYEDGLKVWGENGNEWKSTNTDPYWKEYMDLMDTTTDSVISTDLLINQDAQNQSLQISAISTWDMDEILQYLGCSDERIDFRQLIADNMNKAIKEKTSIEGIFTKNNLKYILMLFLYSASIDRLVYGSKDSTTFDEELGIYLKEDEKFPIYQTLTELDDTVQDMLLSSYEEEDMEGLAFTFANLFLDSLKDIAPKVIALKKTIETLGKGMLSNCTAEAVEWTMSTGANCNISMYNNIKDDDGENIKHTISYWKEDGSQGSFDYTPLKVLDPESKRTALNPRFTQSIDAAILMRVAAKCADSKIWLRGVHDAYYSQINHFWKVHKFYKEAVVECMEEMDNISKQVFNRSVQKRVSTEIKERVKEVILTSKYMTWF